MPLFLCGTPKLVICRKFQGTWNCNSLSQITRPANFRDQSIHLNKERRSRVRRKPPSPKIEINYRTCVSQTEIRLLGFSIRGCSGCRNCACNFSPLHSCPIAGRKDVALWIWLTEHPGRCITKYHSRRFPTECHLIYRAYRIMLYNPIRKFK